METNRQRIIREALETFGVQHQMVVAIEEMGEVQHELCKILRAEGEGDLRHLAEEIVDARICLEQMVKAFSLDHYIAHWEGVKMARLADKTEQRMEAAAQ